MYINKCRYCNVQRVDVLRIRMNILLAKKVLNRTKSDISLWCSDNIFIRLKSGIVNDCLRLLKEDKLLSLQSIQQQFSLKENDAVLVWDTLASNPECQVIGEKLVLVAFLDLKSRQFQEFLKSTKSVDATIMKKHLQLQSEPAVYEAVVHRCRNGFRLIDAGDSCTYCEVDHYEVSLIQQLLRLLQQSTEVFNLWTWLSHHKLPIAAILKHHGSQVTNSGREHCLELLRQSMDKDSFLLGSGMVITSVCFQRIMDYVDDCANKHRVLSWKKLNSLFQVESWITDLCDQLSLPVVGNPIQSFHPLLHHVQRDCQWRILADILILQSDVQVVVDSASDLWKEMLDIQRTHPDFAAAEPSIAFPNVVDTLEHLLERMDLTASTSVLESLFPMCLEQWGTEEFPALRSAPVLLGRWHCLSPVCVWDRSTNELIDMSLWHREFLLGAEEGMFCIDFAMKTVFTGRDSGIACYFVPPTSFRATAPTMRSVWSSSAEASIELLSGDWSKKHDDLRNQFTTPPHVKRLGSRFLWQKLLWYTGFLIGFTKLWMEYPGRFALGTATRTRFDGLKAQEVRDIRDDHFAYLWEEVLRSCHAELRSEMRCVHCNHDVVSGVIVYG